MGGIISLPSKQTRINIKRLTISSVGKDIELPELPCIAGKSVNGQNAFGKLTPVSIHIDVCIPCAL